MTNEGWLIAWLVLDVLALGVLVVVRRHLAALAKQQQGQQQKAQDKLRHIKRHRPCRPR